MRILNPKKPPQYRPPTWMRFLLLAFIGFAVFNAYRNNKLGPGSEDYFKQYPALDNFVSLDRWHVSLNPSAGKDVQIRDIEPGEGDFAACGQTVTLTIKPVDAPEAEPQRKRFTIGDGSAPRGFDLGVRGMRRGAVREVAMGPRLINPQAAPDDPPTRFILVLDKLTPYLAEPDAFTVTTSAAGSGYPAGCGDAVMLTGRQIDAQGETREAFLEPLLFTIGAGEFGHGIDRAVIGMRVGELRRATVPRAYLPHPSPFQVDDKDEFIIVELARLAYDAPRTNPNPHRKQEPETYGPDQPTTESR